VGEDMTVRRPIEQLIVDADSSKDAEADPANLTATLYTHISCQR
jgi:hypothetical protein